jgi:hypothetical protein
MLGLSSVRQRVQSATDSDQARVVRQDRAGRAGRVHVTRSQNRVGAGECQDYFGVVGAPYPIQILGTFQ